MARAQEAILAIGMHAVFVSSFLGGKLGAGLAI